MERIRKIYLQKSNQKGIGGLKRLTQLKKENYSCNNDRSKSVGRVLSNFFTKKP